MASKAENHCGCGFKFCFEQVRLALSRRTENGQDAPVVCKKATSHYEAHTTESYESAFFYTPGEYMVHLQKQVRQLYGVVEGEKRRLIDVGGGTGNFTKLIIENTAMEAISVDPFLTVDDHAGDDEAKRRGRSLHFIKAPAEDFAKDFTDITARPWWMRDYHQILFKEIIHHVAKADRVKVLAGLRAGLARIPAKEGVPQPPSLLIMTRPQEDIDYPMWPEAKKVWAANQPGVEDIKGDLVAAGFKNVKHVMVPYTCSCKLAQWQQMVKNRFWSTFIEFTDEALAAGCEVIAKERPADADGNIKFDDRMLYITAEG